MTLLSNRPIDARREKAFSARALAFLRPLALSKDFCPKHACTRLFGTPCPRARHPYRLKVVEELVTKPVKANLEARTDQVNVKTFFVRWLRCLCLSPPGPNACVGIV